jgi:hypothetical protein
MQPTPTCDAHSCLIHALRHAHCWPENGHRIRPRECTLATIHEHATQLDDRTLQAIEWIIVSVIARRQDR